MSTQLAITIPVLVPSATAATGTPTQGGAPPRARSARRTFQGQLETAQQAQAAATVAPIDLEQGVFAPEAMGTEPGVAEPGVVDPGVAPGNAPGFAPAADTAHGTPTKAFAPATEGASERADERRPRRTSNPTIVVPPLVPPLVPQTHLPPTRGARAASPRLASGSSPAIPCAAPVAAPVVANPTATNEQAGSAQPTTGTAVAAAAGAMLGKAAAQVAGAVLVPASTRKASPSKPPPPAAAADATAPERARRPSQGVTDPAAPPPLTPLEQAVHDLIDHLRDADHAGGREDRSSSHADRALQAMISTPATTTAPVALSANRAVAPSVHAAPVREQAEQAAPSNPSHVHLVIDDGERIVVTVAVRGDEVIARVRGGDDATAAAFARNAGVLDDAMRARGLHLADLQTGRDNADPRRPPREPRERPEDERAQPRFNLEDTP